MPTSLFHLPRVPLLLKARRNIVADGTQSRRETTVLGFWSSITSAFFSLPPPTHLFPRTRVHRTLFRDKPTVSAQPKTPLLTERLFLLTGATVATLVNKTLVIIVF